jgi:hypothetical protein
VDCVSTGVVGDHQVAIGDAGDEHIKVAEREPRWLKPTASHPRLF